MPLYDFECMECGLKDEMNVPIADRDNQACGCGAQLYRHLAAPMGKMTGQVARGGGADRLTAEALGCKVNELPPSLRTPQEDCNG